MLITQLCSCPIQATLTMQVSYIPPPGSAPIFQAPHPPEPLPYGNPSVEMDTVTSKNLLLVLLASAAYEFCDCIPSMSLCVCSDFSGHAGGGGHREHDHAGADRGSGGRRRPLHGHCWKSGPLRPRVSSGPDTQALTSILQHSRRTEEEEERSQQSA